MTDYDKTVRYVHANDWDEDITPAGGSDWAVWNAPRPLHGEVCWPGQFRAGIFYAATRRTSPDFARHAELNRRDAAVRVEVIDNATVAALYDQATAADNGRYTLQDYIDGDLSPAEATRNYGLPWDDDDHSADHLFTRKD